MDDWHADEDYAYSGSMGGEHDDATAPKRVRPAAVFLTAAYVLERGPADASRLPEDLVCAVLGFNDLRTRFACVAACSKFRDAQARLSPGFERSLVLRRFPLLGTFIDDSCSVPPRQLFLSQQRLFESRPFQSASATVGLDDFTFSLEIDLHRRIPGTPGTPGTPALEVGRQTIYVGTGSACGSEAVGGLEFEIPAGVWSRMDDYLMCRTYPRCRARLMVTRRRKSGVIEQAELYQGMIEDGDGDWVDFEYYDIPRSQNNAALDWSLGKMGNVDMFADPNVSLHWSVPSYAERRGPSTVEARFMLQFPSDGDQMTLEDTCLVLEHYVDWSPL